MNATFDAWVEQARHVPVERVVEQRGIKLKGKTDRCGPCPVCGGDDQFSINTKKQVFNCRQCGVGGDVIKLVEHLDGVDFAAACTSLTGEPPPKPNGQNGKDDPAAEAKKIVGAKFEYQDENGATVFVVERIEYRSADGGFVQGKDSKRKKTFRQRRPDPARPGKWIWNVDGVAAVPYRLPELIEAVAAGHTIFVVEGEAKVDLLRSWNAPATCSAMGAGKWHAAHAEYLRGADVVILPDADAAGRDHAEIVAVSLQDIAASVHVLELPGLPPKGDIIDWRDQGGAVEQLHELVAREAKRWSPNDHKTNEPPKPDSIDHDATNADRFKIEMLDEIALADDPVELVQGLLPMGPALGVTYGPPKSLKSFLLIHVGLHIADNRPYCGRPVQGGAVMYVTSEGILRVRHRLIAARRAMGIEGRNVPFALVSTMPNLGAGEADRADLQQAISDVMRSIEVPLRMIVIDTMRRAMPGKSENKQEDVSIVIDNCEALARAFNCLVMLVHHSPRSNDERGSGSNATDAAADVMWSVIRLDDTCRSATATVARYKDGEEGDAWTFELCPAELGIDREGNSIVSCSVDVTAEPERKIAAAKSSPLSPAQQRIFDILLTATIEAGEAGLAGEAAPRGTRAVTKETLKAYAKKAGWWDDENDKSSRARFTARLNELAGKHAIGLTAEHVWPATKSASR